MVTAFVRGSSTPFTTTFSVNGASLRVRLRYLRRTTPQRQHATVPGVSAAAEPLPYHGPLHVLQEDIGRGDGGIHTRRKGIVQVRDAARAARRQAAARSGVSTVLAQALLLPP